jgi:beta-lactamase regulating signal transducer with metallopeptidase domain
MAGVGQSAFLQAIGWATLNSFWQMALLWCIYLLASQFFTFTAGKKYWLSVTAITTGFFWFVGTFLVYFHSGTIYSLPFFTHHLTDASGWLPVFLTAASFTYLFLLIIPILRLVINWRWVQVLKKKGLQKAHVHYKLFVRKVSAQLGIRRPVQLNLSALVKSPVMIGFFKPVILLPVACLNHLSLQQVEAILLHELSHIRRYDYLVNIFIHIAHTFLYFNPFVKFFIRIAESERENCCDQTVLQFGYDKAGYASALLTLEKTSAQVPLLMLNATGKKHLLSRIEKIAGIEQKPVFSINHFASLALALLCVFAVNTIINNGKQKSSARLEASNNLTSPFYYLSEENNQAEGNNKKKPELPVASGHKSKGSGQNKTIVFEKTKIVIHKEAATPLTDEPEVVAVHLNEADAALTAQQKEQVKAAVETTKKIVSSVTWKEVETSIADGMTNEEKEIARQQYHQEVNTINWKNLEAMLKANYKQIDWTKVNASLSQAAANARLENLQDFYEQLAKQIEKAQSQSQSSTPSLLFPDQSAEGIQKLKGEVLTNLKVIKELRNSKVVKL